MFCVFFCELPQLCARVGRVRFIGCCVHFAHYQKVRCAADVAPPNLWKPRGWKVAWNPAEKKGYSGTGVWTRHPSAAFSIGTGHARATAF